MSQTRGSLLINAIDQYKKSKNLFILNLIPNQLYCLVGYWTEEFKPGIFESIILQKGKLKLNDLKDIEDELDLFLRDVESEYENFKKDYDSFFK